MPAYPPPFEPVAYICGGCEEKERRRAAMDRSTLGAQVVLVPFNASIPDIEGAWWRLTAERPADPVSGLPD